MKELEIDVKCPSCARVLRVKVREMVPGRSKHCVCGCEIRFSGADGRRVQKTIDELERKLRRLSRRF